MNFQKSKNIFKEWNNHLNDLLTEITDEELQSISQAIDKATNHPQALPFNDQFGGKLRVVVPIAYDPYRDEGPLGKLLNQLGLAGWKVDLNTGLASKEFTREFEGVVRTQTRQMKVNAIWSSFLDLTKKHDAQFRIAVEKNPDLADMAEYTATNPEIQKLEAQLKSLMGETITNEYIAGMHIKKAEERINEFIKTWQTEASKIKGKMAEESTYSVLFSRHPVDVLRMSDFKDINSCHAPKSRPTGRYAGGGSYYNCAIAEARDGGAIAFLVRTADIKDVDLTQKFILSDEIRGEQIVDPIARLRLRGLNQPEVGVTLAIPEDRVYGEDIKGFRETVTEWAVKNQGSDFDEIIQYYSEDKEINLSDFFRIGGKYQDTEIENLFYKLKQFVPSLEKYKLTNYTNYDATTQNEIDIENVGNLKQLAADICEQFNISSQKEDIPLLCEKPPMVMIEGEDVYIDPRTYYYYDVYKKDIINEKSLEFLLSQKGLRYLHQEINEFVEPKFIGDWDQIKVEDTSTTIRIKFYLKIPDFLDTFIGNEEDLHEYLGNIHYQFIAKDDKVAVLDYIIEGYLRREGIINGGALINFNRYIIDGEAQADQIEWNLEGDENDYDNPDAIVAEIGVSIPLSDIKNLDALKANLSNKTFISQIKKNIYKFPQYELLDVFFDIDDDFMIYIKIELHKGVEDKYVEATREMITSSKATIAHNMTALINSLFKAQNTAPKQKLQEFKYITNRWKMFLD